MRIALITDGIWPYRIGGMQKHSYYLVKYFAQNKIHVDLYHLNDSKYDIEKLEFFTDEEKQYVSSFVFKFPSKGRWPWHYLQESYLHSKEMYERFLKQPAVDFIYTKGYAGWYFIKKKKEGIKLPPIGLRLHGYEIFQHGKGLLHLYRKLLYLPLVNYLNRNADYIYSYGGGITDIIQKHYPGKEIIEIPAAIEESWLCESNTEVHSPIQFAFLGRYEERKGIKELNEALKNLSAEKFNFHFIGPIPEEHRLKSGNIVYHGVVNEAGKIKDILRSCDVFVLPSHAEGMPNVVLEAMASGCAVLAANVGAVSVMVNEDNGWLIPPLNKERLEESLRHIIQLPSPAVTERKKRSVEKVRSGFSWRRIIEKEITALRP